MLKLLFPLISSWNRFITLAERSSTGGAGTPSGRLAARSAVRENACVGLESARPRTARGEQFRATLSRQRQRQASNARAHARESASERASERTNKRASERESGDRSNSARRLRRTGLCSRGDKERAQRCATNSRRARAARRSGSPRAPRAEVARLCFTTPAVRHRCALAPPTPVTGSATALCFDAARHHILRFGSWCVPFEASGGSPALLRHAVRAGQGNGACSPAREQPPARARASRALGPEAAPLLRCLRHPSLF